MYADSFLGMGSYETHAARRMDPVFHLVTADTVILSLCLHVAFDPRVGVY